MSSNPDVINNPRSSENCRHVVTGVVLLVVFATSVVGEGPPAPKRGAARALVLEKLVPNSFQPQVRKLPSLILIRNEEK